MFPLLFLVVGVLILQVVMFFVIRKKRQQEKAEDVMTKYNIKTAGDAFRCINDHSIPEADRQAIEKLYRGEPD